MAFVSSGVKSPRGFSTCIDENIWAVPYCSKITAVRSIASIIHNTRHHMTDTHEIVRERYHSSKYAYYFTSLAKPFEAMSVPYGSHCKQTVHC